MQTLANEPHPLRRPNQTEYIAESLCCLAIIRRCGAEEALQQPEPFVESAELFRTEASFLEAAANTMRLMSARLQFLEEPARAGQCLSDLAVRALLIVEGRYSPPVPGPTEGCHPDRASSPETPTVSETAHD